MRTSVVRVAEDYTKRKNVLRVSAVQPCRSEFLLQAETTEEFADWVKTLQEQVAASTDAELVGANLLLIKLLLFCFAFLEDFKMFASCFRI